MKQIAEGVYRFRFLWPYAFNAYYIEAEGGGIVVDAATRWSWPLMRWQLRGRSVAAVVLTHAHPDHQGCAARICEQWNAKLLVHEQDADGAEGKAPLVRQNPAWEFVGNVIWAGRRSPVTQRLKEGDEIAGFRVVHLPGHTAGHIGLFRERDRLFFVGDVVNTNDYVTGLLPVLRESPQTFSADPAMNRQSIRKMQGYHPSAILPGHGPVLRNMQRLERFVDRLIPECVPPRDTPPSCSPPS
ncbi:MAG TPA: MBL fold metallo-hydrolase [Phycisphaerae bacterium]|nr:MBL fold metallo-hydrolase [Phycisphaerae bacterium]